MSCTSTVSGQKGLFLQVLQAPVAKIDDARGPLTQGSVASRENSGS